MKTKKCKKCIYYRPCSQGRIFRTDKDVLIILNNETSNRLKPCQHYRAKKFLFCSEIVKAIVQTVWLPGSINNPFVKTGRK